MTKKKVITDAEIRDRHHAQKLLRAEAGRADHVTGKLDDEFSQPEIGEVVGLGKSRINDIEASALKKVRIGLAVELGVENLDYTEEPIGNDGFKDRDQRHAAKAMLRHMARDRQKQIHTQGRFRQAAADLPAKMLRDDLAQIHRSEGTAATLKALREQLQDEGLEDWSRHVIRQFVETLEADESSSR